MSATAAPDRSSSASPSGPSNAGTTKSSRPQAWTRRADPTRHGTRSRPCSAPKDSASKRSKASSDTAAESPPKSTRSSHSRPKHATDTCNCSRGEHTKQHNFRKTLRHESCTTWPPNWYSLVPGSLQQRDAHHLSVEVYIAVISTLK